MSTEETGERSLAMMYEGPDGYVWVKQLEHGGQRGAVLYFANPDPRKLHAVDVVGMQELEAGVAAIEAAAEDLSFCVIHGAYDPVHAGADITQFAGDCDYAAIKAHLDRGTALDVRFKALWTKLRTVAILCGDRYGGSVEWPLFAQWAVCDDKTRLQFSEVHLGIVPGWNGILNVMLKSSADNGLYMGQTGNPVDAHNLLSIGLVQNMIATPDPPDRRTTPPEQWPGLWAAHAGQCQHMLLETALELATAEARPVRGEAPRLVSAEEHEEELRRRTDPEPYRALQAEIAEQAAALGAEPSKDELKALTKTVNKSLAGLGKPLAPEAVRGLAEYAARWGVMPYDQLLAGFAEAAQAEADLCDELMHTEHRRIGINAILSRKPAERVPVFD